MNAGIVDYSSGVVGTGEAVGRPVHTLSIAVMGVPLVDNGHFEDVAREAASRTRWEFLTTAQLTRVPGGTATTFNALAAFYVSLALVRLHPRGARAF
jgi:hypothetical protein